MFTKFFENIKEMVIATLNKNQLRAKELDESMDASRIAYADYIQEKNLNNDEIFFVESGIIRDRSKNTINIFDARIIKATELFNIYKPLKINFNNFIFSFRDMKYKQFVLNSISKAFTASEIHCWIDKELNKRRLDFINRIEKVGGKIISVNNLHLAEDGNLNGTVQCENKRVKVTTILAAGDIYKAHFRVLVKEVK